MKNRSLLGSFRCALVGLREVLRTERHSQIAAAAIVGTVGVGLLLRVSRLELVALVLVTGLVLIVEMLNTSIEATIDLAAPYIDPLAGKAKDIAAGAVLVAIAIAVAVGLLILIPHLLLY